MKVCIICRKEKDEFSDEHVIPDSLKGYYHIYSVCKTCNSALGANVDSKLVNHSFIESLRYLLAIKGKSGSIPNPFAGTHTLKNDPEQKVTASFNEQGQLKLKFLPKISFPNINGKGSFSISLDVEDFHLKDQIIGKILKRRGIDKSRVNFKEQKERVEQPWINSKWIIDTKDFRIGLLKIAYEFAVDTIPNYFDDDFAKIISSILFEADLERMAKEVTFFGNGFDKEILKPLSHLIDFGNNNHYLALVEVESIGLICQVNIFNCFSIAIKLSNSKKYLPQGSIIGVNDISKGTFEKLTIYELVNRTYSPLEYRFQYWLPDEESLHELISLQKHKTSAFIRSRLMAPSHFMTVMDA